MNSPSADTSKTPAGRRARVAALLFFLLGIALTVAWFEYGKNSLPKQTASALSGETLELLRHLNSPVQIRFYSVLPAGTAPQPLQEFSRRVDGLLSQFQTANEANVRIIRNISAADANADAAAADGLQPFNLEKGDACFLGISVVNGERKESLPRLQPEWESALPYDLARAIQRVSAPPAPAPLPPETAKPSPEIIQSINRLIPKINSVSIDQADQIFHAEFMNEYMSAGAEMEAQDKAAREKVVQAQNSGSPDDLAAAQKNLMQVQLAQGEKIKRIAADLQTRQAVFRQMKAATNAAK